MDLVAFKIQVKICPGLTIFKFFHKEYQYCIKKYRKLKTLLEKINKKYSLFDSNLLRQQSFVNPIFFNRSHYWFDSIKVLLYKRKFENRKFNIEFENSAGKLCLGGEFNTVELYSEKTRTMKLRQGMLF